jgi:predicted nucleic acid-binding protein
MTGSSGFQFVDTNILVYAHDVSAGDKHERAKKLIVDLWHSGKGCLSIQVLQELYVTIRQKIPRPVAAETASQIIVSLAEWRLHTPGVCDLLEAIEIHQRHRISFWDALIICSAVKLDCAIIWTENLSSGQDYEGVKALNPFI